VRDRRDDEIAIALETYEAPIEQVIDTWGQEQSVLRIEPFGICSIPPGLAVTGDEVHRVRNIGDPAGALSMVITR
jgi:hypothetical protein